MSLTGAGVIHGDAAPFVELHNAERLKRAWIVCVIFHQQLVSPSWCRAAGGAQKQIGLGGYRTQDALGGFPAEGLMVVGYPNSHKG